MTDLPQAFQLYSRTAKGTEVVKRWGHCPTHGKRSNKFIGVQTSFVEGHDMWAFRCPEADKHLFYNDPDPTAPQDLVGVEAWKQAQRLSWLKEKGLQ